MLRSPSNNHLVCREQQLWDRQQAFMDAMQTQWAQERQVGGARVGGLIERDVGTTYVGWLVLREEVGVLWHPCVSQHCSCHQFS